MIRTHALDCGRR